MSQYQSVLACLNSFVFATEKEAKDILTAAKNVLDYYGFVSVADLHDLAALPCSYICNKYGWINLETAEATKSETGYTLILPKPILID